MFHRAVWCFWISAFLLSGTMRVNAMPSNYPKLDERQVDDVVIDRVDFDEDDEEEIILENRWLRLVFEPEHGATASSVYYKPAQVELTKKRVKGDWGGVFGNVVDGIPAKEDWFEAQFKVEVVKQTPQQVAIKFSAPGKTGAYTGVTISKTFTMRDDSSRVRVDYRIDNNPISVTPLPFALCMHNAVGIAGQKGKIFWPVEQGIWRQEMPGGHYIWERNPPRGSSAMRAMPAPAWRSTSSTASCACSTTGPNTAVCRARQVRKTDRGKAVVEPFEAFLLALLVQAGYERPVTVADNEGRQAPVRVFRFKGKDMEMVGLLAKRSPSVPEREVVVHLPEAAYVYDVVNGGLLSPVNEEGAQQTGQISTTIAGYDVRVYALLNYPMGGLKLAWPRSRRQGEAVTIATQAVLRDPPLVDHVYRIKTFDPDGKPFPVFTRNVTSKAGFFNETWHVAENEMPGPYTVRVREVFSGVSVDLEVEIKAK